MVTSGRASSHMSFHKVAQARGLTPKAALKSSKFSFQSATSLCPVTRRPCSSKVSASKMRLAATILMNEGKMRTTVRVCCCGGTADLCSIVHRVSCLGSQVLPNVPHSFRRFVQSCQLVLPSLALCAIVPTHLASLAHCVGCFVQRKGSNLVRWRTVGDSFFTPSIACATETHFSACATNIFFAVCACPFPLCAVRKCSEAGLLSLPQGKEAGIGVPAQDVPRDKPAT